jgi:hypothetical protein
VRGGSGQPEGTSQDLLGVGVIRSHEAEGIRRPAQHHAAYAIHDPLPVIRPPPLGKHFDLGPPPGNISSWRFTRSCNTTHHVPQNLIRGSCDDWLGLSPVGERRRQ